MIECRDALQIARDYYFSRGQQELTKVYETDQLWIVYGGKKGFSRIGSSAISINKKDGEIKSFLLPSKENFAILKAAKLIDVELHYGVGSLSN